MITQVVAMGLFILSVSTAQNNIGERSAELLKSYRLYDAQFRGGRGFSDRTTSGGLAWGEARFLRDYMLCYYVSRDTYWLDKIIAHFDRMMGALADMDGDGYLEWRDRTYSVGIAHVKPQGETHGMRLEPMHVRQFRRELARLVTGHRYQIKLVSDKVVTITDLNTGALLANKEYKERLRIAEIPGFTFTLRGKGRAGVVFVIETIAPEACEYQVHDGMVTYPIALFVETVWGNPALHERYKAKADEYAMLIHSFLHKWERTWVDLGDAGVYKFTNAQTQRFPGYSLPHNQYLALARTWLVMQAQPHVNNRMLYRERAEKMARYFKKHLRLNNTAYVWNYWDMLPHETGIRKHIEDYSHGSIDISFAVEACKRGVVFTRDDMRRFASTWVDVMWDGNRQKPRFGARVNTNQGGKVAFYEWALLGIYDARAYELAKLTFNGYGQPISMVPMMLYLYDQVEGIPEQQRKLMANR